MSCNNNNTGNFNETIILEPVDGDLIAISACTGIWSNQLYSCTGDSEIRLYSGETIFNTDIVPTIDSTISVGTKIKRFREINTVSGYATIWSASSTVYTVNLDLGTDSLGNPRIITANNSVIQNDILNGGVF